jgi:hypothetical protein
MTAFFVFVLRAAHVVVGCSFPHALGLYDFFLWNSAATSGGSRGGQVGL